MLKVDIHDNDVCKVHKRIDRPPLPIPVSVRPGRAKQLRSALLRRGLGTQLTSICLAGVEDKDKRNELAWDLAVAFAQNDIATLLVDADFHRLLRGRRKDEPHVGLAQILLGDLAPDAGIQRIEDMDQLGWIPVGLAEQEALDLFDKGNFKQILDAWSTLYEVVIIAAPAASSPEAYMLAASTDAALLILRPGRAKLASARQLQVEVEAAGGAWLGAVFAG